MSNDIKKTGGQLDSSDTEPSKSLRSLGQNSAQAAVGADASAVQEIQTRQTNEADAGSELASDWFSVAESMAGLTLQLATTGLDTGRSALASGLQSTQRSAARATTANGQAAALTSIDVLNRFKAAQDNLAQAMNLALAPLEAQAKAMKELIETIDLTSGALNKLAAQRQLDSAAAQDWLKSNERVNESLADTRAESDSDKVKKTFSTQRAAKEVGQAVEAILIGSGKNASDYLKELFQSLVLEPTINLGLDAVLDFFGKQAKDLSAGIQTIAFDGEKAAKTIGQAIEDFIKGGGKNAAGYLKGLFKSLVLQPMIDIGFNAVLGLFAKDGKISAESLSNSLMDSFSNGFDLLSTGKSIYDAISGGFASLSGNVAEYVQGAINWIKGSGGTAAQGPIQIGGFAQGVGTAAGIAAGVAGGVYGGRMISGGYSAMGGSSGNSAVNIGTLIGTIWGPAGSLIGGLLGGAVNRLFGRKLKDSGIGGEFTFGEGFDGFSYENYKGGLFRSNKTKYNELDEETSSFLGSSFALVVGSVANMAEQIGIEAERINNFSFDFNLSTKGMDEEAIQAAMAEVFANASLSAGDQLMAGYEEYIRSSENSVEALTRLSQALTGVNGMLDTLGLSLFATSVAGADMASQLVDLFGGFEAMTSVAGSYMDRFYSEQERADIALRQVTSAFKDLGFELPQSKQALRALIEEQDLTTEKGRELYAALMMLSGAFADTVDAAQSQAKALQEVAQAQDDARQAQLEGWMRLGGLSVDSMSQGFMQAMNDGQDPGVWLAEYINGGFQQAMQMQALNMVMQRIMDEALAPAMDEIMTDLFGERGDQTATTAENAVLQVFDAMDTAFASITGESVLNLGEAPDGSGGGAGMQALADEGLRSLGKGDFVGGPFDTELAGTQEAIAIWLKSVSDLSTEAVAEMDLSPATEALSQILYGLVDEETLAGLAEMLAGLPGINPEEAEALAALTQEALGALFQGVADGSMSLFDASLFANAAFDGMAGNLVASSTVMLNASAQASAAAASASVSEANASIGRIQSAEAQALSLLSAFMDSPAYKEIFGESKPTPKPAPAPPPRNSGGGGSGSNISSQVDSNAKSLVSAWESVYKAIFGSMNKLRDSILGTTQDEGNSFYEAQFALLTAQARAGDKDAADKLPDIVSKLQAYALGNSSSLFEQNARIAAYIQSLEATQQYVADLYSAAGGDKSKLQAQVSPATYAPASLQAASAANTKTLSVASSADVLTPMQGSNSNNALLSEMRAMREELAAAKAELQAMRSNAEDTAANTRNIHRTLDEVTGGGEAMITKGVTA
ncbi:hypothetical protein E8K88_10935 [Lampropedia aestuarii]|uniref:Bacteriophage tail tape measure N-terminal domain-containing protein n=1 Tax=Lampropedia aestuarii TaxID=2562762 RepID=A0A4S5BSC6_9BURK|nr:hypothetical protein [Lampropedia aestuarii]THJ32798.1 hypothetical protein E8K88_10935 [Lampropedia aestuarii]